jgi:ribonuclease P protein component
MRFTFKKEERLYGHAALENVYENGKHLHSNNIKILFLEVPQSTFPACRVVFSVPKRNFKKAVERNLIKRRMREVYRNHKHLLYEHLAEKQKNIHVYLIYSSKQIISFDELKENLLQALQLLANRVN